MKTVNLDRKFAAAIVALILISTAIGALVVQQYFPQIGSIKAEGMEDPLEAWSEASYIIWQYNTTFYASRNMSIWDTELSTNASKVIDFADKNMTGGTIFFRHATYSLDTPIYPSDYNRFIGEDDNTILSQTTANSAVFHLSAGINNVHIENMRIQNSSAGTNCTGIYLDGNYHKIMNVWLDNLAYGMVFYQSGSTCDNWYENIYVNGFKDTGFYIVKAHDSHFEAITIGTNAVATAAIRWDEGGSGCHFTSIHIWGSATLTYGIWLGSGSGVYQYDAFWDSVEIEDNGIQLGLYIQASADYNHFSNLWFKSVINASVIIGDYNTFTGINLRAVGDYGLIIQTATLNINGGYITDTGKTAIFISTAYLEYKAVHISNLNIYNSGTDTADSYADIDVYHTKYIQLSGINTQGTNVRSSINFTDCTNGMLQNSWVFDKPILTSGTSTSVEIHTSYNVTAYIT